MRDFFIYFLNLIKFRIDHIFFNVIIALCDRGSYPNRHYIHVCARACVCTYLLQVGHRVQVNVLQQVFSGEDPEDKKKGTENKEKNVHFRLDRSLNKDNEKLDPAQTQY